jgi:TPR repeat protein
VLGVPVHRFHLLLLVLALAATLLALGYVSGRFWRAKPPTVVQATSSKDSPSASANRLAEARTPEDLRQLAEQGNMDAQYVLGARYHNGDGVPQSDAQATQWFLRAAEQGHVVAQATLGAYYWAGRGVPKDLSKAYFWSVLARAGNDEASKYRVAVLTSHMTRAQVLAAQQQAEVWIQQHASGAKPIPH